MASWKEFEHAAPALAAVGQQRIERHKVVMLATVRRDGSARVTPVEHMFHEGELTLGMMPGSMKGRDLIRDPRITVHNLADDGEGEFKIIGRAVPVEDDEWRAGWEQRVFDDMNWRPPPDAFLFNIDIDRVWAIDYSTGKQTVQKWPS